MTIFSLSPVRLILLAIGCVAAMTVLGVSHDASAQSAVGSGGGVVSEGGSGDKPATRNGHGWFQFSVDSGGPADFQNGTTWPSVQNTCRNLNTEFVIVYVITRSNGSAYNARAYDFENVYETFRGYRSQGGGWLSVDSARAAFNSIDSPPGFVFGSNVSWFCYTEGGFEYQTGSYIVPNADDFNNNRYGAAGRIITVRPGQTVYWRHLVDNVGNRPGVFRSSIGTRYNTRSYEQGGLSGNRNLAAGATFNSGTVRYTIPAGAADGATYCQNYRLDRTSRANNNDLYSGGACARVQSQWVVRGSSRANVSTAAPGQTITWRHTLRNAGPNPTTEAVSSSIVRSGFESNNGTTNPSTAAARRPVAEFRNSTSSYTVRPSDAGRTLCQRIQWQPTAHNNAGRSATPNVCVTIPFNYTLVPRVAEFNNVVEPGSELRVRSYIDNDGPTRSRPSQWQLTRLTLAPGQAVPAGSSSAANPCAYFTGTRSCQRIEGGDNRVFELGEVALPSAGHITTIEDLPVGSRICFAMSVQPRAHNTSNWQHSNLECTVIGKKPKVQIWGGDVASRGRITASTTDKGATTYGSWVEYAALARGAMTGLSSGAGLANPEAPATNLNLLSFTNHTASLGNYTSSTYWSRPLALSANRFSAASGGSSLPGGNMSGWGSGTYRVGNVNLSGGDIPAGRSIIIVASGTVTIDGNITYTDGSMGSIADIPQVVIIAGNINIAGGVERVDAWLLAPTGNINTCSDVATTAALNSGVCNRKLTVNGPVVADKLHLRRTAGSGAGDQSAEPAEVFNLRADAYVWAYLQAGGPGKAQTVLTTEKAPRY